MSCLHAYVLPYASSSLKEKKGKNRKLLVKLVYCQARYFSVTKNLCLHSDEEKSKLYFPDSADACIKDGADDIVVAT